MCASKTEQKQKDRKLFLFSDEFYSDLGSHDMLYAIIIRSPYAYGKIQSICFDKKVELPENYSLITAKDIPGNKYITTFEFQTPVFCEGEIQYKGEPLGLLTGPDKKVLNELVKKIVITLDKEDFNKSEQDFERKITTLSVSPYDGKALKQRGEALRQSLKILNNDSRSIIAKKDVSAGDVDSVFKSPAPEMTIIDGTWENSISFHDHKETEGCYCFIKSGKLFIYSPCQWISHLKKSVCSTTGLKPENVRITRTNLTTRNTNSLWMNGLFSSMASIAAVLTKKPVMLCLSREEQAAFIENSTAVTIRHKTAIDKDGFIKAMDIGIEVDTGSFNPCSKEVLDRFVISASGIYKTENLRIKSKIYSSKNPPSSINFSTIDSQVFFAIENQIQKICEKTSFSPLELKLKNLRPSKAKNTIVPFYFDLGRVEDSLNAVCRKSDFNRKYIVYKLSEKGRLEQNENSPFAPPLRGIGLASAFEGNGYLGKNFNNKDFTLQITASEDGKLIINAIPPSKNISDIWIKQIQDQFKIERKNIIFGYEREFSDRNRESQLPPDGMIGNISIKTYLLEKCLQSLKRKGLESLPVTITKTIPVSKKSQWNSTTFTGMPFFNTSFGCCVVEVEYDSCTYSVQISGIYVVIDCGRVLNAKVAETNVKHKIRKTLGTIIKDEKLSCDKIVVNFAKSEEEPKQIGNLVQSILPPAFTSAVSQAIAKTLNELPIDTDSIYKLKVQERKNENSRNS